MTQPDKLVVSQEARNHAADVLVKGFSTLAVYEIRDAEYDEHPLVQAFQRAMNQAADEQQEMCAKLLADLRIGDCVDDQDIGWNAAVAEGEKVIRAIGKGGM